MEHFKFCRGIGAERQNFDPERKRIRGGAGNIVRFRFPDLLLRQIDAETAGKQDGGCAEREKRQFHGFFSPVAGSGGMTRICPICN